MSVCEGLASKGNRRCADNRDSIKEATVPLAGRGINRSVLRDT